MDKEKIMIKIVLYLILFFEFLLAKGDVNFSILNNAFGYYYYSYWEKKYPYIYKRYTNDLKNISKAYYDLMQVLDSYEPSYKKIKENKEELIAKLYNLIRKSRDLTLKKEEIIILDKFLKQDLYTIKVDKFIRVNCNNLNSEYKIKECTKVLDTFSKDNFYHNKNFIKHYRNNLSIIKKLLNDFQSIKCNDNDLYTQEDIENTKECIKEAKKKLAFLEKTYHIEESNIPIIKEKYKSLEDSLKRKEKLISTREEQLEKEKKDNLKFWFYLSVGIIIIFLIWHFFIRLRCPKCRSLDFTEIKSQERFLGYKRYLKQREKGKIVYKPVSGLHSTRGNNEKVEKIYEIITTYKCNKCGNIFTHTTKRAEEV